jgi:polyphosphate kinase 2 (PPK2 family)
VDKESQERWEEYSRAKEDMFFYSSTVESPWIIIKSSDKRRARIESIRFVLQQTAYPEKNSAVLGYDRRIVRTVQEEVGID